MSHKIIVLSLLLFISSCKEQPKVSTEEIALEDTNSNREKLNGTWELVGFYNYKDNVVVDSFALSLIHI